MARNHPLPLVWLLSDARNDAWLDTALPALPANSGFVFRHYHLHGEERARRYHHLREIAWTHGHRVILAGNDDWPCDGRYDRRPAPGGLFLASAHDGDELERAARAGADGIFLSPVFATRSHPGAGRLGVHGFHVLAQRSPVPVIALGGMSPGRAAELAWPRWGAIDGLAPAPRA